MNMKSLRAKILKIIKEKNVKDWKVTVIEDNGGFEIRGKLCSSVMDTFSKKCLPWYFTNESIRVLL